VLQSGGAEVEAQVDEALTRLFLNRMKTGEFDPPEQQPYRQIPPSAANSPEHQALALTAAAEGLTLLKNIQGALPLSAKSVKSVAVIGPNANCTQQVEPHGKGGDHHCNQLGNYATESPFVITPADGIGRSYKKTLLFVRFDSQNDHFAKTGLGQT
jgi:beta-glucosidase-like glycosyl hydrolase